MTNAEFARNLAITTATLVPEAIMLGIFGKAVSGIFSKAVTEAVTNPVIKGLKHVGTATLGETAQETLETVTDNWLT